jgi:hypothetical protein
MLIPFFFVSLRLPVPKPSISSASTLQNWQHGKGDFNYLEKTSKMPPPKLQLVCPEGAQYESSQKVSFGLNFRIKSGGLNPKKWERSRNHNRKSGPSEPSDRRVSASINIAR